MPPPWVPSLARIKSLASLITGLLLASLLAFLYAYYNSALHELRLWFSAISPLEREISFRTESGLYYSFYKQLVPQPQHQEGTTTTDAALAGMESLFRDQLTEWPREINAVQRFNIYQEIALAKLFTMLKGIGHYPFAAGFGLRHLDPILFYIQACFGFTGLSVLAVFLLAWQLSGEKAGGDWLSGLLASAWLFANQMEDSTRAHFTVNLRENFALPAFWMQNFFVVRLLMTAGCNSNNNGGNGATISGRLILDAIGVIAFTFIFSLFWQFNQYLLGVQSLSLLAILTLYYPVVWKWSRKLSGEATTKAILYYDECKERRELLENLLLTAILAQSIGFAAVIPAQYFQPMLLAPLNLSVNLGILAVIALHKCLRNVELSGSWSISFVTDRRKAIKYSLTTTALALALSALCHRSLKSKVEEIFYSSPPNSSLSSSSADSHIWSFVAHKLHELLPAAAVNYFPSFLLPRAVGFESALYLCHEAFSPLDARGFWQRNGGATGPLLYYAVGIVWVLGSCLLDFYSMAAVHMMNEPEDEEEERETIVMKNGIITRPRPLPESEKKKPDGEKMKPKSTATEKNDGGDHSTTAHTAKMVPLAYISLQSLASAVLAATSMRMKYVWVPQMAVVAAICMYKLPLPSQRWPLGKYGNFGGWMRWAVLLAFSVALLQRSYVDYEKAMANEQEFYDPDTVELMEWILRHTHSTNSSFTGSMQLMAAVRACTLRPILNHPHFEDPWLRARTQRLYQIYARRPVEEVHTLLRQEGAGYIILEDSICLATSTGCSTNDIVDYANGHETDSGQLLFRFQPISESKKHEVKSRSGEERFCNALRKFGRDSNRLFRLTMENRTFRVYRVLPDY